MQRPVAPPTSRSSRARRVRAWRRCSRTRAVREPTPCRRARSGISARRREEARRVPQLEQSILRRQLQDSRYIVEHVRALRDDRPQRRIQPKAGGVEQANERVPGWARRAVLDPHDDRLGGPGPTRERALSQSRAEMEAQENQLVREKPDVCTIFGSSRFGTSTLGTSKFGTYV